MIHSSRRLYKENLGLQYGRVEPVYVSICVKDRGLAFLVAVGIWPSSLVHDIVTNRPFLFWWDGKNAILFDSWRAKGEQKLSSWNLVLFYFFAFILWSWNGSQGILYFLRPSQSPSWKLNTWQFRLKGRRLGGSQSKCSCCGYREIWTLSSLIQLSYYDPRWFLYLIRAR